MNAAPSPTPDPVAELLHRLLAPDSTEPLQSATLSGPRHKPAPDAENDTFRRVDIKPVAVKSETLLQFEHKFPKKVTHRNLPPAEAASYAEELLQTAFTQGVLRTGAAEYHLIGGKGAHGKGSKWTIRRKAQPGAAAAAEPAASDHAPAATPLPVAASGPASAAVEGHNRSKNYLLSEGEPVPFLVRLGVMTAEGRVVASRWDKFRQVNRFLEMVRDTLDALPPEGTLRVLDFGSGRSYLTFALYHFLHLREGRDVEIVGLDLKRDVIEECNGIARDLGWSDRLRFVVGDIASYAGDADGGGVDVEIAAPHRVDMVVSLHACDTATDDALAKAVGWGASVILSVPCCQHELFRKIGTGETTPPEQHPLLKHGLLKERLASLVTDALRAQMLERQGYAVQVLEFIDLEHTPKNLLLRAVRRARPLPDVQARRVASEYDAFRAYWLPEATYIERAFATDFAADAGTMREPPSSDVPAAATAAAHSTDNGVNE